MNDQDWDEDERAAKRSLQAFARAAVTVVPLKGKRHEEEQGETLGFSNTPFEGLMGDEGVGREGMEDGEQEAGDVEEVVGRASEPWREDGYEPFLQRGLEGWTQLYPACSFTGEHPWNAMDWTAKYFGDLSHSTICSECNRWLE